jgi:hypothetical protein
MTSVNICHFLTKSPFVSIVVGAYELFGNPIFWIERTVFIAIIFLNVLHSSIFFFLQQVLRLFQSQYFRQCDLVFTFSNSSIFALPSRNSVAAYAFFLFFPFLLSFLQKHVLEGSSLAR